VRSGNIDPLSPGCTALITGMCSVDRASRAEVGDYFSHAIEHRHE
jgi:hypothetical protein